MKIKRFFAKDIRTALDEIKVVLGADAIIMSNKKVDGGVEIVAAIDEDNIATIPKAKTTQAKPAPIKPIATNDHALSEPAIRTRSISEDQVSLSGFQDRLVKQQMQAQADQFIAQEPANQRSRFEALTQAVERRQSDNPPELPAWAQTDPNSLRSAAVEPSFKRSSSDHHIASGMTDNGVLDELRQEMASMRQLLQHQVNGLVGQDTARRDPIRSLLLEQLVEIGFDAKIAQQLVTDVPLGSDIDQAKRLISNAMMQRLKSTNNEVIEQGGIVALLGPTGVGKTTTVAKLAARYAMEFGSDQIALITTDSYRIGAFEQLNTYGIILGCPVKVAKDTQQLADALYQLRHKRLILIDTAGMGQRDLRLSEQLSTLVNTSHVNIRSYLVLPATAQRKVLQEAIEQFRKIPIVGCILTKMDEALGVGEVISVAIGHSLPIGYITNGQRVPEDIGVVDIKVLVNSIIEQLGEAATLENSHSSVPTQFVSVNR